MSRPAPVWPWYTGALALIAFDQVTKALVRFHFQLHESRALIGDDLVRLTYVLNPGIAFGLTVAWPKLLLVFGWTAAVILAVYLFVLVRRGDPLRWPVTLFLAGAIGNSIDRTLFGQVTDFMDVDFPNFIMERWPVFNVADSCVTVGIAWLILQILFDRHRGQAEPSHSPSFIGNQAGSVESWTSSGDGDARDRSPAGTQPVPDNDRPGPAAGTD